MVLCSSTWGLKCRASETNFATISRFQKASSFQRDHFGFVSPHPSPYERLWRTKGPPSWGMAKAKDDLLEIVDTGSLVTSKYVEAVRDNGAGAISTFSGTTRDTFHGREVVELRYEAYKPMALLELKKMCSSARTRWSLIGIAVAHRLGVVPVGEESVFIAVSSAHRKDALEACQFLIDELKATVPIWKKEVYSNEEVWKENGEFLERSSQVRS